MHALGILIVLWDGKMVHFPCLNKMLDVIMYGYNFSTEWEGVSGRYLELTAQPL